MCGKGKDSGLTSPAGTSNTAIAIVVLASLLLVASAVVFFVSPPPAAADEKWPPEPVELAIGVAGHEGWLDALGAWAKLACLKLRPLEPRYILCSFSVHGSKHACPRLMACCFLRGD